MASRSVIFLVGMHAETPAAQRLRVAVRGWGAAGWSLSGR